MFALTPGHLLGKILDCAAGPSSFNAELTAEGHEVTSCDPLYSFTAEEIRARIDATFDALVANARVAYDEFIWRDIESPEHLGEVRMAAMQRFLADFPEGLEEGRYLTQALPHLDFHDDVFDLACATRGPACDHLLSRGELVVQANLQVGEGVDKRLDDALYPLGSSCSPGKSGSWRVKSEAKFSSTTSSLRRS
jgi:hypothetical protein